MFSLKNRDNLFFHFSFYTIFPSLSGHSNSSAPPDLVFPNKRGKDLVEFKGTIVGKTRNGKSINITFVPESKSPIIVNIENENNFLIFDEYLMKIFIKLMLF